MQRSTDVKNAELYIAVVAVVAVILGVVGSVYLEGGANVEESSIKTPKKIGEYTLTSEIKGSEAIESTRQLHVGSVEDIKDAVIAAYVNPSNKRVHLWIGSFVGEKDAFDGLERMVAAMRKSPQLGFTPENYTLNGMKIYVSLRAGSVHVFWAEGNNVLYLLFSETSVEDSLSITEQFISEYQTTVKTQMPAAAYTYPIIKNFILLNTGIGL